MSTYNALIKKYNGTNWDGVLPITVATNVLYDDTHNIKDIVDAEATARANADNTLQQNISNETTARTNADNTLQQNITNEATARTNADNTLQQNITNEATARTNAINVLTEKVDNFNNDNSVFNVLKYGVLGNGTDETSKIINAFNDAISAHGTLYIPAGLTVVVDVVKITNASNFNVKIDGVLKGIDNASYTDASARSQLMFTGCSNFNIISYNADMNVEQNGGTIKEHRHALEIYDCSDFRIGNVRAINVCGDVIYIAESHNVIANNIVGIADDTGRNTLSVISGENMQFNNIISIGVGTEAMPGGVDCEPNVITDIIKNIQFNNIYVKGKGSSGFALSNNIGSPCSEVIANNVQVVITTKTGPYYLRTGIGVTNFNKVKITGSVREEQANPDLLSSLGVYIIGSKDIEIDVDIDNVYKGGNIGYTNNTNNLLLRGTLRNVKTNGLSIGSITNSVIDMVNEDCLTFNVLFEENSVVDNLTFKGEINKGTTGFKGIYFTGTCSNVTLDCKFRGYTDAECMLNWENVANLRCRRLFYHALTLVNGWSASTSPVTVPAYCVDIDGIVRFKGNIIGTGSQYLAVVELPASIKPTQNVTQKDIYVETTGNIKLTRADVSTVYLDELSYTI